MSNIHRIRTRMGRFLRGSCLEDLSPSQRRDMWPAARPLDQSHIQNCKMLTSRDAMLDLMPKDGVCIEVGILHCEFSRKILKRTSPRKLHLVDIKSESIQLAEQIFRDEIANGRVEVHHGDSAEVIDGLPQDYFDWVYIDGDHSYEGVKRDLNVSYASLKSGGLMALNDYIFFGPSDFMKYGVMEAVNEFCLDRDFEMIYFALQGRGYYDVCLRKKT